MTSLSLQGAEQIASSLRGSEAAVAIPERRSGDCFALQARSDEPMRFDAQNLAAYEAKLAQGLSLRAQLYFYIWPQPSLSAGKLQIANPTRYKELQGLSRRLNLPLVTRPTGGRLVLHGGDICYTFIAALNDKDFGGDLRSSFCKVNRYVFSSLRHIEELRGFFEEGLIDTSNSSRGNIAELKCFASTVAGEAVIAGSLRAERSNLLGGSMNDVKFIGAAQAMGTRAYIQQGSIQLNRIGLLELEPQLLLSDLKGEDFDLAKITSELNKLVVNMDGK